MNFGERLRFARERMGLTQEELAKRSRVQLSQISKFENGYVEPSLHNFRKIVTGLRISADFLLDVDIKKYWEEEKC